MGEFFFVVMFFVVFLRILSNKGYIYVFFKIYFLKDLMMLKIEVLISVRYYNEDIYRVVFVLFKNL